MYRFYFYHLWDLLSLESFLRNMEDKGYLVDCIFLRFFFHFRRTPAKAVQYLVSPHYGKDAEMQVYEHIMKRDFKAVDMLTLDGFWMSLYVFRIPNKSLDVGWFINCRSKYLRRTFAQKLFLNIICLFWFSIAYVSSLYTNIAFLCLAIIEMFIVVYDLYGFYKTGDHV